jgi:2-polyprenyl-3-methyl-5-hydroxy-6-metoxy-1,4-benzoquinol methylase
LNIWDVGCGYGTLGFFLISNGFKYYGTTLEFYYEQIENRKKFWKNHIDLENFKIEYKNVFDNQIPEKKFDIIVAQDTLHHLEPLNDALVILKNSLNKCGKIIVCEENGNNIISRIKLFLQRGNKRIIEIYDEKLQKTILLGNENIKSFEKWNKVCENLEMKIDPNSVNFVRFFPPQLINKQNYIYIIESEQKLWKKNTFLKNNLFFGINFIVSNKNK